MLHTTPHRRLQDDLAAVEQIAARPATTAKELAANLTELYDATFNINFERYDVQTLVASAPDIARTCSPCACGLRDQVADWHARGFLTLAGQRALRNALRIARYATDMLGEINIRYAQLGPGEKTLRGFSGRNMNTLLNPAFDTGQDLDFRSGDLLLMRGMHHNSAAIARIGDVDSQFSHLAIVHTDDDGKHWVVEALIEEGSVINPLSYTLTHGLGRCVLFRHRDKQLAARAAALIHDVVRRSGEKGGKHIWYDFTMELAGDNELFCSKLVRKAFALASDKKVVLPTFSTRFDMKNRDFVDRIGVTAQGDVRPGRHRARAGFRPRRRMAGLPRHLATAPAGPADGPPVPMDGAVRLSLPRGSADQDDRLFRRAFGKAVDARQKSHRRRRAEGAAQHAPLDHPGGGHAASNGGAAARGAAGDGAAEHRPHGRPLHAREVYDFLEGKRQASNGEIGYLVGKA